MSKQNEQGQNAQPTSETLFEGIYKEFLAIGWSAVLPDAFLVKSWRSFVKHEAGQLISDADLNEMLCDQIAGRAAIEGLL